LTSVGKTRKNSGRSQIGGGKDMITLFSTVLAQTGSIAVPTDQFNTDLTLGGLVSWAMTAILVVAAIAFFFMLILGGIRWILSGGDKANTESARNQVTAAIIGLIVVFGAYVVINFVSTVFGINVFDNLDAAFTPVT